MASHERAAYLTQAVVTLQEIVHTFQKDIESGRVDFILESISDVRHLPFIVDLNTC